VPRRAQPAPMMVGNPCVYPNGEDEAIDEDMEPLTDEQLVLTSCMVKGYSMKAKRWGMHALLLADFRSLLPNFS
jgi:hypothetical protein